MKFAENHLSPEDAGKLSNITHKHEHPVEKEIGWSIGSAKEVARFRHEDRGVLLKIVERLLGRVEDLKNMREGATDRAINYAREVDELNRKVDEQARAISNQSTTAERLIVERDAANDRSVRRGELVDAKNLEIAKLQRKNIELEKKLANQGPEPALFHVPYGLLENTTVETWPEHSVIDNWFLPGQRVHTIPAETMNLRELVDGLKNLGDKLRRAEKNLRDTQEDLGDVTVTLMQSIEDVATLEDRIEKIVDVANGEEDTFMNQKKD